MSKCMLYYTGLEIQCEGSCHVSWSIGRAEHSRTFEATESYMDETLHLYSR